MKRNRGLGFVIVALILIGCSLIAFFGLTFYNGSGRPSFKINGANDIRLGIDIRGGVEAVFQPENNGAINVSRADLDKARAIIELRLDKNNITDRDVTVDYGAQRILVRFPWQSSETSFDPNKAILELGQMGHLTFKGPDGSLILEGSEVSRAYYDRTGSQNIVQLEFNANGAKKFAEATAKFVGKPISIYMDNDLISDPNVKEAIIGGKCYIEGADFTPEYCKNLANLIASGSLPFKLVSNSNQIISPTLGQAALNLMVISGVIAFILVCLFMLFTYRLPGLVACIALCGHVAGQILVLSVSHFTLTLPGIAGIILSVGMGVDANVIIAARIKEELYSGKTIRAAIDTGYKRAFATVFDSNATSGATALLLWILGTGTMISFGITLFLGVIFNFIIGVWFTNIMQKSLTGLKLTQHKWLYGYDVKEAALNAQNL